MTKEEAVKVLQGMHSLYAEEYTDLFPLIEEWTSTDIFDGVVAVQRINITPTDEPLLRMNFPQWTAWVVYKIIR